MSAKLPQEAQPAILTLWVLFLVERGSPGRFGTAAGLSGSSPLLRSATIQNPFPRGRCQASVGTKNSRRIKALGMARRPFSIELRNVEGRLRIACEVRYPDDWEPPIAPYDPYGPGTDVIDHPGDEVIDD
jgi:hypothetical protein